MTRNQLSGKYGTFIGINVLYILITLVASNLMDLVLGTSSILNPLTATSATVETLGISHTVVYYLSTFILSLILSVGMSVKNGMTVIERWSAIQRKHVMIS